MIDDNLYFLQTPAEIQEEVYDEVLEKIKNLNIPENFFIYLKFVSITNIPNKFFFQGYAKNSLIQDKSSLSEPDFLIFLT